MASTIPPFAELIADTHHTALHLEMRDSYTPGDPVFRDWVAGRPVPEPAYPSWYGLVREHTARGVAFRRARIVSEPLSRFTAFEYDITTGLNTAAGEQVRWLPRRRAAGIALPAHDFWLFDDRLLRIHHFDGEGEIVEDELSSDPDLIKLCAEAFAAVWERAVPHGEYRPLR
ncbi:DUF6879 family protein [Nocardiopsis composta]|uniref:DUF6879 domain-containing protein n=1 Tax=Nocardiopsis composta TaxID=157465 RepID=A0A7W8QS90_9ACTN|nr:DUF6879 family protein [Nocardiopsis composta]MBB5435179.1 hypothetical protein [Nocardiopsis composta]